MSLNCLPGAAVLSRLGVGYLSDKVNPWLLAASTAFCTSVATFTLWGILSRLAGVLAFGIVYGAFKSGWLSLWISFVRPVASAYFASTSGGSFFGY